MKVFQILSGICYWDATGKHPTLASTVGMYAPDILFVETPDYVFEGWGYNAEADGDARFIQPTPPSGWGYDTETGGFYPLTPVEPTIEEQISLLKQQLAETDYKIIKCSEYQMVGLPLLYDIEVLHADRQALRDQINELEGALL